MDKAASTNGMLDNKMCLRDIEEGFNKNSVSNTNIMGSHSLDKGHDSDIDVWVGSIERILQDLPQFMCKQSHPGRITRLPENLRAVDQKAYEPYVMSIGPYHHGKPRLQHMENRKQFVLKCVLERRSDLTLTDYLREIKTTETEARSFYSDVEMDSEKFVTMLLLDSLYIITMFCGISKGQERMDQRTWDIVDSGEINEGEHQMDKCLGSGHYNNCMKIVPSNDESNDETSAGDNNVNTPRWFWSLFMHDIFLLENQLPFFVLQGIYNLVYGSSGMQLVDIVKANVGSMLSDYTIPDSETVISPTKQVHHLLHLCHMFFRPCLQQTSTACQLSESSRMFRLGSATQLYNAGVTFEARSGLTKHSLLDITVTNSGKMTMPCLYVDDNIDSLLRNLIALEQMKYPSMGLEVTAYAVLMLHLVTTPADVELLRKKGIIEHHLASDKEMMRLVNRLSVGLSFDYIEDKYYLKPVFQELKRYTEQRVPGWTASLRHRYFKNPWTVISLLAASLLLLLAVLETFYTVYSYYFPCCIEHP